MKFPFVRGYPLWNHSCICHCKYELLKEILKGICDSARWFQSHITPIQFKIPILLNCMQIKTYWHCPYMSYAWFNLIFGELSHSYEKPNEELSTNDRRESSYNKIWSDIFSKMPKWLHQKDIQSFTNVFSVSIMFRMFYLTP